MQIVVGTTFAFLAAGRFGLAPTAKRGATPGLKLVEDPDAAGLKTGDPAGNCTGSSPCTLRNKPNSIPEVVLLQSFARRETYDKQQKLQCQDLPELEWSS